MERIKLVEITKGKTGTGLLVENDGFISLDLKENKTIKEALEIEDSKLPNPFIVSAVFQKYGIENANGRIYPEDVLKREVEKYQKAINERRAYGECYTDKALCLTENGWKPIADVKKGEKVLTLNPETQEVEIQEVTYKTENDWDGNMIHIKGNHIDEMVTPNHGFPIYDRNHKFSQFITAQELQTGNYSHFYIPKQGIWKGDEPETIILKGIPFDNLKCKTKRCIEYGKPLSIPTDIFCAFMGIYLSEGHFRQKGYGVCLTQKKNEVCLKIEDLLNSWGIKYSISIRKNGTKDYLISDGRLHEYCKQFGHAKDKYIPLEIKKLSSKYLTIFYDWYVMGDGRIRGYKKYFSPDVFSISKQMAMDLNEIQFKMGFSGSFHEENRKILSQNSNNMFFTYCSTVKGIYIDKRFLNVETVPYKGKVYCIEVPNHIWYVMENGKCHWTKNCNHPDEVAIDLGRIAMNIIELHWEGHTLVGKMEIPISKGFRNYGFISSYADMVAQWLISGLKIGVSSRGMGTVLQQGDHLIVGNDYSIICWDVVSTPSTPNAWIESSPEKLQPYIESKIETKPVIKEDKYTKFEHWLNG